jgi:cytochrome bd-type quinol oxidase subunit 1
MSLGGGVCGMDLPVIEMPILSRWVWMEEITVSHFIIATLITAFMVLAPIYEYIGIRKKDLRYDRLAKSLIYFSLILFSPGAALGTGIPMFIIGTYPEFWSRWSNLFFWPLIAQFIFFLAEVGFLFFGYYLTWDRMMNRKRLHLFFGVMAAIFGLLVQAVWDGLGSYMLTPGGVTLPGVKEPVAWSAQAFFNPSYPFLFFHRFFGNASYTMLLVGGVFALKYMRAKDPKEKDYFGFASNFTFGVGFFSFFVMPFIGWGYAGVIKRHAPVAFHAIMGGHVSTVFIVKMALIGLMVLLAGTYLFLRYRHKVLLVGITIGLASIYLVFHWHPALDWLPGGPMLWRVTYTVFLTGFLVFLWVIRGRASPTHRGWQWTMFIAGLAAFVAFNLGGFVRERSRSPYTVYLEIVKPEVLPHEADRFLLYQKCVRCHHKTPKDFIRYEKKDWDARVAVEQQRPDAGITDEEAARLIRYLKEHYR